jgi:putative peptide zinc metalloprotease protein
VRAWVLVVVPLLLWMLLLAVCCSHAWSPPRWTGLGEQADALTANASEGDLLGLLAGVLKVLALVLPVAAVTYLLVRSCAA